MLGLRVRGRGGRDQTATVAAPKSAFLWGSTPFLCARAKKWGGTGRASAVYCLIKRRTRNRARQGGLVIVLCACAPLRWVVVVAPCCHSTPFLWCLPKETVSSRQRKALLKPPHHLGGPARLSHLGVSPNGTNWCVKLIYARWVNWPGKVSLTQSAGMLGLRVRGRGGRDPTAPVAAPISAFLWGSTPFLCARAKKWGGTGSRGHNPPPSVSAHTYKPTDKHQPPPTSRARNVPTTDW